MELRLIILINIHIQKYAALLIMTAVVYYYFSDFVQLLIQIHIFKKVLQIISLNLSISFPFYVLPKLELVYVKLELYIKCLI